MQLVLHEWLGGLVVGLVGGSWSDAACPTCNPAGPILEVPDSSAGLRRRKRDWVIPPISLSENLRGVFPKEISKIKSSLSKEIRMVYSITGEGADQPPVGLFTVNRNNGSLYVTKPLDREAKDNYVLQVHAVSPDDYGVKEAPMEIIVNVIDQNDNKPIFTQNPFLGSVPEASAKDFEFMTVTATDADDPNTANADIRYSIISQSPQQPNPSLFDINPVTGGIRVKSGGLDRENYPEYTLLIQAADLEGNGLVTTGTAVITVTDSNDNAPQFEKTSVLTSTATVIVNVQDVNEAPVFDPVEKIISKPEDLAVETELIVYTATDPDTEKTQTVTYRVGADPAGWLSVDRETGLIRVRSPMDRESPFMKDGKYKALILAVDDDPVPATGTGTLVIVLEDVNDNAPVIEERSIRVCNKESTPVLLSVTDKDGPGFADPYTVELQGDSRRDWTARMDETKTGIILTLKTALKPGEYNIILRVYDASKLFQDNVIQATVCDCTGEYENCPFIITQHMNNYFCLKV
ncbi:B-cadherin-like [Salminus brasiliensis]|uniref:B-cadherin-like n=1 Tax=Salminus brasiliensis TaxID=930266 RepID=UPI003B8329C0